MRREMIRAGKCLLLGLVVAQGASAAPKERYANPNVFEVNREPAHAFSHVFSDVESARPEPDWANPFAKSSRYLMLNGTWKFKWTENIVTAPKEFFKAGYNVSRWDDIQVPLPWQMADYGQIYYYNCRMPMLVDRRNLSGSEPRETEDGEMDVLNPKMSGRARQEAAAKRGIIPEPWNPVGSYVRNFTLPKEWKGMRTVLHFSGAKSGLTSWVNGKEVGYSQDSFTPAEFDITQYLKPGKNTLAVQVLRWTDGAYLENQDRIRLSGIIRDVYLFATPKAHIGDFFVRQTLNDSFDRAQLSLDIALRNTDNSAVKKRSVEVELIDPSGKTVLTEKASFPTVSSGQSKTIKLKSEVVKPMLWHTENPQLYTALIKLFDNGKVTEVIRQDVGFRRFDWDEKGNTHLNGKRYYMRGVNRSDCNPKTGYYVDYADMLEDALTMKRLNIDSVRASHNPSDIRWYAICNRLGITLVDEANVEAHQHDTIYSDLEFEEPWRIQSVWRMQNMVERDKNQPSVIIWSIGNEQFPRGEEVPAIKAMYDATKEIDPTRGVICERTYVQGSGENCSPFLDLLAPMYGGEKAYVERYQKGLERRPFFLSEYAHAMGNSDLQLKQKWQYFEEHDGLNGGHIWDWRDQSVYYKLPGLDGKHLTYGGDWSKHTGNDGTFCMNGIVLPNRGFTGKSYETKATYQQIEFMPLKDDKIEVRNKFALSNINEFDVEVSLVKDGFIAENKKLNLSIEPLTNKKIDVPFDMSSFDRNADYRLNYDVRWRTSTPWSKSGDTFAQGQVGLQKGKPATQTVQTSGKVNLLESDSTIVVKAGKTVVEFDKSKMLLTQITTDGKKLLDTDETLQGVEVNFNYQPTDDFVRYSIPRIKEYFKKRQHIFKRKGVSVAVKSKSSDRVLVETENKYVLPNGKSGYLHKATYTILPSGVIQVDNYVKKFGLTKKDFLLRVGARVPVVKEFKNASYLAYGPNENYKSRRAWERYGVHKHDAMNFFSNYVRPQECGNRSDMKWIALQNSNGVGLELVGENFGNGTVMPWTVEQFDKAPHVPQLPESTRWILKLDAVQPGINKWSAFFVKGDYTFSYSLRPLRRGDDAAKVAVPVVPKAVKTRY